MWHDSKFSQINKTKKAGVCGGRVVGLHEIGGQETSANYTLAYYHIFILLLWKEKNSRRKNNFFFKNFAVQVRHITNQMWHDCTFSQINKTIKNRGEGWEVEGGLSS